MAGNAKCAPGSMSAEDKEWRARSDADTLSRAHEIMSDKSRHGAAKAHAAKEAARYSTVSKGMDRTGSKKPVAVKKVAASPLKRARGK